MGGWRSVVPEAAGPDAVRRESPGDRPEGGRGGGQAGRAAPRKIIHIDMDAFFASVEQRDDPSLRGLPVAVGGARERGVVAAASYEARRFGVRSAMPSVVARRKCPELVFVKPRFEVYRAVSQEIRAVFAEYTPVIEPLSLDEAYLDVTENLRGIGSATEIAERIRAEIRARTGLTASAGVSYNKFLAKLASDQRKPDGLFVITPRMGPGFVEDLPVGRFHGVGPKTAARMEGMGIHTGRDLRAQGLEFLQAHFGKAGAYYHAISRAEDERPVRADGDAEGEVQRFPPGDAQPELRAGGTGARGAGGKRAGAAARTAAAGAGNPAAGGDALGAGGDGGRGRAGADGAAVVSGPFDAPVPIRQA